MPLFHSAKPFALVVSILTTLANAPAVSQDRPRFLINEVITNNQTTPPLDTWGALPELSTLSWLFLGTREPTAHGPVDCGEDPKKVGWNVPISTVAMGYN